MFHKITITVFIGFILSSGVHAQWNSLGNNIIDVGHRIYAIKVAPDRSVWATSTADAFPPTNQVPKVYRSIDEGNSWTHSSLTAAISNFGRDIAPVNQDVAFVAMDPGGLYKTADGGENWVKVSSFAYAAIYVHFFNENDGWVLAENGDDQLMCVTEDGGETWMYISYDAPFPEGTSLPPRFGAEDLAAYSYTMGSAYDYHENTIAVGISTGAYWISKDKGKNWERKPSPLVTAGLQTCNLTMKDENTIMVASDLEQNTFDERSAMNFATTDGGESWVGGSSGLTAAATHYIPGSDSVFIMVGHTAFDFGQEGTAISYDYGENWEIIDNVSLIAVDFLDGNTGFGGCCNNFWQTANGQIHKWTLDLSTSTNEIVNSDRIKIMPNPVQSDLMISFNGAFQSSELQLEVIAVDGEKVISTTDRYSDHIVLPVSNLEKGYYVLRITGDDRAVMKRFVKI